MKKRILLLAVFTLICAVSFAVAAKPGKVKADEAEKTNFHFSINLRPSDETMEKIQYKYMDDPAHPLPPGNLFFLIHSPYDIMAARAKPSVRRRLHSRFSGRRHIPANVFF